LSTWHINNGLLRELQVNLPFISNQAMNGLRPELPRYKVLCQDIDGDIIIQVVQWWIVHSQELPNFQRKLRDILTLPTSIAAAERNCNLMNANFNNLQNRTLTDMKESSLMLQYNNRPGLKEQSPS
jgi:hypothetical protein